MTDDLMRAMTRLAERGTPVGVDEMVDRIEAELAPHPDAPAWPSWVLPRTTSRRRIGAVLARDRARHRAGRRARLAPARRGRAW